MPSLFLRVLGSALLPLLLVLSVWVLLRGHNEPGGGFTGGLLASGALLLYGLGHGSIALRKRLWVSPETIAALGLLLAFASGLLTQGLMGDEFLTAIWWSKALGTPLLFDIGVYFVVVGSAVSGLTSLWRDAS